MGKMPLSKTHQIDHRAELCVRAERAILLDIDTDRGVDTDRISKSGCDRFLPGPMRRALGDPGASKCEILTGHRWHKTRIVQERADDEVLLIHFHPVDLRQSSREESRPIPMCQKC